ncbi:TetR family transcriptional regulator [Clostridium zeae]|uniref:TetR family transcriptional regulator n=1 Tax=Clostridium zeae TaxID=2759022 RepID=A0ABQ1E6C4_9CLOT|nr:TetR/AcrR family transcriptional regulator [Clostridium zeae]GFZ30293.1 TetR family transcriptional regulator [Clostridium zeae]
MAQTTKKALAASLKKLLSQKPMDKITIFDIVEDCEVNRQTFYYHFKDIYDLVEWIYTNEASQALGDKKTYDTWQQGFMQIFEYVSNNKDFVLNTYHSLNREHLENYLYSETYNLLLGVVEEKASGITVRNDDDKAFIAHFYKYAFVGLMLEWIGKGMKDDPSAIIARVNILIHGSIVKALENFGTTNHI